MKKATNMEEIYNIFAPEKYLQKEDEEFYVDLYGIDFKKFIIALQNNQIKTKSFFIAGQSGNGKSTVLNLLTTNYPKIEDKYEFNYIAGRTIFLYEDIDIIDILLMIGNTLTKNNVNLQKKYFEKLKKLEDIKDGSLEESSNSSTSSNVDFEVKGTMEVGAKFLSIIKANVDLEASYRINEEIRKDARRFFKIKRKELIDLTNEIIQEYKTQKKNDKDLIIVIDDLEKKDNIDNLFLKDISLLNELNIVKIITMPIYLHRNETFPNADVREFGLKLKTYDGKENIKDKNLLRDVVLKRLEDKNLITDEAIDFAVKYSGANLRQLIRLIHLGAEEALTYEISKICIEEIEKAKDRIQLDYSSKVMNMRTFLSEVAETKSYKDNNENLDYIAKATKMELIFAYFNGIVWYELNPVVVNALKIYTADENSSN